MRGALIGLAKLAATAMLLCVAVLVPLGMWVASWFELDVEHFQSRLPSNIRPVAIEKDSTTMLSPLEGCGVAILRLGPDVAARIAKDGLSYLNSDLKIASHDRKLEPWRATPVSDMKVVYRNEVNIGIAGLEPRCSPDLTDDERKMFLGQLTRPGGYWTEGHELLLIIGPDSEFLVFSSHG